MIITDHKVNGLNEAIRIEAIDNPGPGGAYHSYLIELIKPSLLEPGLNTIQTLAMLRFQNGPISKPEDMNGLTNEALLAVIMHRLLCFQAGPFLCRENAIALTHLEEAMMWLQKRTRDRMARGVEGTLKS